MNGICVAVGHETDILFDKVIACLEKNEKSVLRIAPQYLADLCITIEGDILFVNQQQVESIFWRCPPEATYSASFLEIDRRFVDTEVRSVWLAALQLSTIRAVNRFDAISWFDGSWFSLRRRLIQKALSSASIVFSNQFNRSHPYWLPYQSFQTHCSMPTSLQQLIGAAQTSSPISKTFLIVNSRVFGVSAIPQVVYDAQSVLDDLGLNLLEITADLQGSILTVNSYPIIDSDRIESIAMLVSEKLI